MRNAIHLCASTNGVWFDEDWRENREGRYAIHQCALRMKKDDCAFTRATFVSELKNRFRCCVKIHDEETMCYVPSSCKLSNFVDLSGCEVLLLPTTGKSEIPFSLYAAETTSGVVLLNLAEANRIIASSIRSRRFAFLGKRERIRREISIDDTDTIIEIKTILSLEKDGHFPTVHSIRSNKQLEELERLLDSGHKVCYLFVALCPKTKRLHLDFDNQYTSLFNSCIEKGMRYYGCGLKMSSNGFSVVSQLEVIPQ